MASSLATLREDRKVIKSTYDNPLTSQSVKNSLKLGLEKIDKLIAEMEKEESEKKEFGKEEKEKMSEPKSDKKEKEPEKDKKKSDREKLERDCAELVEQARKHEKAQKERREERQEKGLPQTLTPKEVVKKAAEKAKEKLKVASKKSEKQAVKEVKESKESIAKMVRNFLSAIKTKTEKRQFLEYLISALKKEYKGLSRKAEFGMMLDKEFAKGGEIAVFNVSAGDNFDRQITIPVDGRNENELKEAAQKELEKFHPDSYQHYNLEYEGKRTPKYEKGGEMDCGCKFISGGEILDKDNDLKREEINKIIGNKSVSDFKKAMSEGTYWYGYLWYERENGRITGQKEFGKRKVMLQNSVGIAFGSDDSKPNTWSYTDIPKKGEVGEKDGVWFVEFELEEKNDKIYHGYLLYSKEPLQSQKMEDGGEILGKIPTYFGKGENLDVFGYQTKHFDNSAEASEFFKNIILEIESDTLIHIDIDKEFISNAAENLDRFFEIENTAIEVENIDEQDINQAINSLLIAQSYIAMARIGKVLNFVDNHVIALISFFDKNTLEISENPVEDLKSDSSEKSIGNLNDISNEENDDSELADNDIYKEPKSSRNSEFPEWKSEIIENIMNKANVDKEKAIQLIEKWEKDNQRIFNIFHKTIRDSNDMADAIIENGELTYYNGGEIGFKEWESTVLSDVMDKGSMGKPRAIQAIDMYEDEFIPLRECYYLREKSPGQVAQEIIDYTFDEIPDEELEEDEFKRGGETKHIGFKKLAEKVAKEYREKGYSAKDAKAFGKDTAGKIRWVKENKAEKGVKIGFKKLAHKIEDEYEKEGFSTKRAKEIGIKTAAKVRREKEEKAVRGKHLTSKQKHYADKLMRHGTKEYIALAKAKNKR